MSNHDGRLCRLHFFITLAALTLAILAMAAGCGKSDRLLTGGGEPHAAANFPGGNGDWPMFGNNSAAQRDFAGTFPVGSPVGFNLPRTPAVAVGEFGGTPVIGMAGADPEDGYNLYALSGNGSNRADLMCYSAGTLRFKWCYHTTEAGKSSSPGVGPDGNVFFVTGTKVHCIDPSGTQVWQYSFTGGDTAGKRSSPTFMTHSGDDWVVVPAGNTLYALDTDDGTRDAYFDIAATGTWRYLGSGAHSPANYAFTGHHLVYVARLRNDGTDDLVLTAVDLEASPPAEIYTRQITIADADEYDADPIHYQHAINWLGDKVYFAANDALYGMNDDLTDLGGSWPISGTFTGSPALYDNFSQPRAIAVELDGTDSIVHAYKTNGTSDWDSDPYDSVASGSPAIDSSGDILVNFGTGSFYVGSMQFFAIDINGSDFEWDLDSEAAPLSGASLVGDVMAAEPDDGTGIIICAAADDGRLYARSLGSGPTGALSSTTWPMASYDAIDTRRSPYSGPHSGITIGYSEEVPVVLAGTGAIGFTHSTNSGDVDETSDEQVFVEGEGDVYRFDNAPDDDGCLQWRLALSKVTSGGNGPYWNSPALAAGVSTITTSGSYSSPVLYSFGGTDYVISCPDDRVTVINRSTGSTVATTGAFSPSSLGYVTANPVVTAMVDNGLPPTVRMVIFVLLREPDGQYPYNEFNVKGYALNGGSLTEVYHYDNLAGDFIPYVPPTEWGLTMATVLVPTGGGLGGGGSTSKTYLLSTTRSKVQAFTFPALNMASNQTLSAPWSFNPTGTFQFGGPGCLWTNGLNTAAKLYTAGAEGGSYAQVLALDVAAGGTGSALAWYTAQIASDGYLYNGFPLLDSSGYIYVATADELHIYNSGASSNSSPVYDSGDLGSVTGSPTLSATGFVYLPIEGSSGGTGQVACFYDP